MKAIRVHQLGEPDVMQLEETPELLPGPIQVVVEVKAIGVNPVDTYIRAGIHYKPQLPYTPGFDCAGIIKAIGTEVKSFKVGDRVYTAGTLSGSYAQAALCFESQVHPLPNRVTFEQGAAVGMPYATAYRALFDKANAKKEDTVLIHGASGGVGIAAVQLAKYFGMNIIATVGTEKGKEIVKKQAAHHVLNHKENDYLSKVMTITNSRGVDIILEMLADQNLGKDLGVIAQGGRVIVIGCRGKVEINPRDTMSKEAAIIGMTIMRASPEDTVRIHNELVHLLTEGALNPSIREKLPLKEAPLAHKKVMEPGAYGKIVLIP